MAKEIKRRYAINFDLTIKQLETFYSKENPKRAYTDIKRFMSQSGFHHRQWSGYISDNTMTKSELIDFTTKLHNHFPWLINCEESMDATVITSIFDLKQMILDSMADDDIDVGI